MPLTEIELRKKLDETQPFTSLITADVMPPVPQIIKILSKLNDPEVVAEHELIENAWDKIWKKHCDDIWSRIAVHIRHTYSEEIWKEIWKTLMDPLYDHMRFKDAEPGYIHGGSRHDYSLITQAHIATYKKFIEFTELDIHHPAFDLFDLGILAGHFNRTLDENYPPVIRIFGKLGRKLAEIPFDMKIRNNHINKSAD